MAKLKVIGIEHLTSEVTKVSLRGPGHKGYENMAFIYVPAGTTVGFDDEWEIDNATPTMEQLASLAERVVEAERRVVEAAVLADMEHAGITDAAGVDYDA